MKEKNYEVNYETSKKNVEEPNDAVSKEVI